MSEQKSNDSKILRGITMYWVKLGKDNPAPAFGDGGPKWEFQARTTEFKQAKEWMDLKITVKPVLNEESGQTEYWKASFRKPTHKKDGTEQAPVKVLNGSNKEIDPSIIGNGSVCNVRIFQFPYEVKSEKPGGPSKKGVSTMLMAVQVTKLVKYQPRARGDDFDTVETEIVEIADNQDLSDEEGNFEESVSPTPATKPVAEAMVDDPRF